MTWQLNNFACNPSLHRVGFAMSMAHVATNKSRIMPMKGFPGT